jgi:uncharacterized protein
MSNELVIDSISFAKKSESLQGKIAVGRLERVTPSLASLQGEIDFRLQGELDDQRRPNLRLQIAGQVMLTCQRCLVDFPLDLAMENRFVLVARESELPDLEEEDPDVDFLLATNKLNVQELIEDEIILSLPLAPKHSETCAGIGVGDISVPATSLVKSAKPQ